MLDATRSDRSFRLLWFMQKKYSDSFTLCATHCHSMGMPRLCNFQWSSLELPKMQSSSPPAAHLQHILLDKQNLEIASFRCFPLLFLFGSSSTTVLLNLVYSFNYHGWYNWKMSNSIKFLKVVCCICAESFIYLHYFRKLWRVVKYMLSYSPQRQQKLLFTFLNS